MVSPEKLYTTEAVPRERRISVHRRVSDPSKSNVGYSGEVEMKSTLQELLIYCIFLIDICILAFGMVDSNMYTLNKAMQNLFLETPVSQTDRMTFNSITRMTDFWKFAEGPLLNGLFWKTWYNNQTMSLNESYIYYENILLGVAQIRQVKVRGNTCRVHPFFRYNILDCFHTYFSTYEDKDAFGSEKGSEWTYSPAESYELEWGIVSTYFGGGFKKSLSRKMEESLIIIQTLKEKSWLTRGTRATFIDFSVYNANINLFCVIRLLIEFPATGGAIPSSKFYAVKLLRYVTLYDYFLAACEVLFCLFILGFIFQEIMKCKKYKADYFKSILNWIEIVLVLIFKYIRFSNTMSQLSSTLSRCAKDITGFAFMFFIIFLAYAQLANLIFGTQVEEFSTFPNCIYTQFRIILGDFSFASIEHANRILGPIYFISYVFFVFFVLLNMFLAIINDTYSEVKADFSMGQGEFDIGDLIRQSYERALVKLKLRKATVENIPGNKYFEPFEEDVKGPVYSAASATNNYKHPGGDNTFTKYDLDGKETALAKRQKWKERLWRNYYSNQDDNLNSALVTQHEYQKMVKHSAELEKKLSEISLKLDGIVQQNNKETGRKEDESNIQSKDDDDKKATNTQLKKDN
ncbi:polycystin-2-like protein 2 isoform X4 [Lissotriton helveticus]